MPHASLISITQRSFASPQEEFRSIMLPAKGLRAKLPPPHADLLHERRVAKGDLPQTP